MTLMRCSHPIKIKISFLVYFSKKIDYYVSVLETKRSGKQARQIVVSVVASALASALASAFSQ